MRGTQFFLLLRLLQDSDGCLTLLNKYLLVLFKNCIRAKFGHLGIILNINTKTLEAP